MSDPSHPASSSGGGKGSSSAGAGGGHETSPKLGAVPVPMAPYPPMMLLPSNANSPATTVPSATTGNHPPPPSSKLVLRTSSATTTTPPTYASLSFLPPSSRSFDPNNTPTSSSTMLSAAALMTPSSLLFGRSDSNTSDTQGTTTTTVQTRSRSRSFSESEHKQWATNQPSTPSSQQQQQQLQTQAPPQQQQQQQQPSIAFCPSRADIYGCINCIHQPQRPPPPPPPPGDTSSIASSPSSRRGNKLAGPVLLQLGQLRCNNENGNVDDDDNDEEDEWTARRRHHNRERRRLFRNDIIGVSRGNPQLGSSVASTCLSFSQNPQQAHDTVTVATGLTTGALCLHTFRTEPDSTELTSSVDYFSTRYHRPATAVAWRSNAGGGSSVYDNHVAIGLTHHTTTTHHTTGQGLRRANPRMGSGGDRDFCCLIWDIERQSTTTPVPTTTPRGVTAATSPLLKLSHNAGVASLAWLSNGNTLAVGSQVRNLQLYDVRGATATSSPPTTTWAHNDAVHGIEMDPERPHILATFSSKPQEPVKIWDRRRMVSPLHEIKLTPTSSSSSSSSSSTSSTSISSSASATRSSSKQVRSSSSNNKMEKRPTSGPVASQIAWSSMQTGVLSVAVGKTIQHYDTTGSRSILIGQNTVRSPVVDMAVNPLTFSSRISHLAAAAEGNDKNEEYHLRRHPKTIPPPEKFGDTAAAAAAAVSASSPMQFKDLLRNRMLVVTQDRSVQDVAKSTAAPLGISSRDGTLVHGYDRTLWMRSVTNQTDSNVIHSEDIATTIKRRADCMSNEHQYAMNADENMVTLAKELNIETATNRLSLMRLWSWIARAEQLCESSSDGKTIGSTAWPTNGNLTNVGVWTLLGMDQGDDDNGGNKNPNFADTRTISPALSCEVYDSPARRAALRVCGWGSEETLFHVIKECEDRGEYARAAALAVWHGDIVAAVTTLQNGSEKLTELRESSSVQDNDTPENPEILELLSMCVAGFNPDATPSSSRAWQKACNNLQSRLAKYSGANMQETASPYIASMLSFLLSIVAEEGEVKDVVENEQLSLCDRVAFGCRFLSRPELRSQLQRSLESCKESGEVQGLAITGITRDGIEVLQAYMDAVADVQTAALVTCRVIMPSDWRWERQVCSEWLDCYRGLLNTWQMWQSRALFDVDRADALRKLSKRQQKPVKKVENVPLLLRARGPGVGRRDSPTKPKRKTFQDSVSHFSTPTQLDARCNYCSFPLSAGNLRRQPEGVANKWLSKSKPVISCCPKCRKPLPRCAICLLPLGVLNPYIELQRERVRRGAQKGTDGDMSSLANLPFAEWFTWCMFCKHGGHAQHLVGWFANNDTCPVSGCNCKCQFDGIQRLQSS